MKSRHAKAVTVEADTSRSIVDVKAFTDALKSAPVLTPAQKQNLSEVFELFDIDGSGRFDLGELKVALRVLGFALSKDDLKKLLLIADDSTGTIGLATFSSIVSELWKRTDKPAEIRRGFRALDIDGTGVVTAKSLQAVCRQVGEPSDLAELEKVIEELVGKGQMSAEDFQQLMTSSSMFNY
eukprot:RCo037459